MDPGDIAQHAAVDVARRADLLDTPRAAVVAEQEDGVEPVHGGAPPLSGRTLLGLGGGHREGGKEEAWEMHGVGDEESKVQVKRERKRELETRSPARMRINF